MDFVELWMRRQAPKDGMFQDKTPKWAISVQLRT
jgi:hypothetical protein